MEINFDLNKPKIGQNVWLKSGSRCLEITSILKTGDVIVSFENKTMYQVFSKKCLTPINPYSFVLN